MQRRQELPVRFAATKVIEGDHLILKQLEAGPKMKQKCWSILCSQMEKERGLDRSAAIADMRFDFIEKAMRADGSKAQREQGTYPQ